VKTATAHRKGLFGLRSFLTGFAVRGAMHCNRPSVTDATTGVWRTRAEKSARQSVRNAWLITRAWATWFQRFSCLPEHLPAVTATGNKKDGKAPNNSRKRKDSLRIFFIIPEVSLSVDCHRFSGISAWAASLL